MHVHVQHADGEAKFWLTPKVELSVSSGLSPRAIREVEELLRQHEQEVRDAWNKHFPG
jgi:hypothetical protein